MSEFDLYAFDMDGTLVRSFMREGAPREDYDKVEVLPRRLERLRELSAGGARYAIITNQGGVAFGYQTEEQVGRKIVNVVQALEGFQGRPYSIHVAYGHSKAKLDEYRAHELVRRRKPSGVMLIDALLVAQVMRDRMVFVGDHETDEEAAKRAGVAYRDAEEFFA